MPFRRPTPALTVRHDRTGAGVQRFVDACVAAEGDYLHHVGSDDTVRDLDKERTFNVADGVLTDDRAPPHRTRTPGTLP